MILQKSLALIPLLLLTLSSCAGPPRTETELWLGTGCSITIYGRASGQAFTAAFDRVEQIHRAMSLQEPASELNRVNNAPPGAKTEVSAGTAQVLQEALRFSQLSEGSFDPTVGSLVELWDIRDEGAMTVPGAEAVIAAAATVDYSRVEVNGNQIVVSAQDTRVDVGGIAKGYAADQAAAVLRENGVRSALLDFGGNILLVGRKPDRSLWRVGVQNPLDTRGRFIGILELEEGSVVTSGVYERFFIQDGQRYHHILDPETGYPARTGLLSVTIVTTSSMTADALSTAVFVMGADRGLDLVGSLSDVEAILVTEDFEVLVTSGLRDRFRLTDDEFRMAS